MWQINQPKPKRPTKNKREGVGAHSLGKWVIEAGLYRKGDPSAGERSFCAERFHVRFKVGTGGMVLETTGRTKDGHGLELQRCFCEGWLKECFSEQWQGRGKPPGKSLIFVTFLLSPKVSVELQMLQWPHVESDQCGG
jgi:hypothetical protein